MCVIIKRPADHGLTLPTLESAAKRNDDGWGLMAVIDGLVQIHRGMQFKDFVPIYESLPANAPMGIHFRIRTHGKTDLRNCHPYQVLDKSEHDAALWVMHNGVIRDFSSPSDDMSDTWHWVKDVARPNLEGGYAHLLERPAFRRLLESTINGGRMLFMNDEGVMNSLGPWSNHEGCPFSNALGLSTVSYHYKPWTPGEVVDHPLARDARTRGGSVTDWFDVNADSILGGFPYGRNSDPGDGAETLLLDHQPNLLDEDEDEEADEPSFELKLVDFLDTSDRSILELCQASAEVAAEALIEAMRLLREDLTTNIRMKEDFNFVVGYIDAEGDVSILQSA